MLKRTIKYAVISPVLVVAMLLQPLTPLLSSNALAAGQVDRTPPAAKHTSNPALLGCQLSVYLPLVIKGGGSSAAATTDTTLTSGDSAAAAGGVTAAAGPEFAIISPSDGGSISGMLYVAAQPADPAEVTSVTFCAGETVLGIDSTPADGFKVFLDADTLPAGPIDLIALASGPGGQALQTISVNVVSNPSTSGIIGSSGGVLASEIGSIITIPPGAVPDGTNISVTEKTQEQVTADNGIDWDAMGVTFLGAQEIQSTAEFSKPLGVSSAGFGNRVQPGQAVVNYRIIPDADGDGVDEIVVINTASVAPNNDVVADPVPQIQLNTFATISSLGTSAGVAAQESISGPPGTLIEIEATGFNPLSVAGNIAIFKSSEDGTTFEIAANVEESAINTGGQILTTAIPPLPVGNATLTFENKSTGALSEVMQVTILSAPPLNGTAQQIIEDFLLKAKGDLQISLLPGNTPEEQRYNQLMSRNIENIDLLLAALNNLYDLIENEPPEIQNLINSTLEDIAVTLQGLNHNLITSSHVVNTATCGDPVSDALSDLVFAFGTVAVALTAAAIAAPLLVGASAAAAVVGALETGAIVAGGISYGLDLGSRIASSSSVNSLNLPSSGFISGINTSSQCTSQCIPSQNNSGPGRTGMGAAPPPGGNGCGSALPDSNAGTQSQSQKLTTQATTPIVVKLFSGGTSMPFTGLVDDGGYFFIPLIPQGEPFTALAIDTGSGQTRTFEGVGPAVGESVFMFFDFYNEQIQPPTITWDGGGDGINWSDPLNWDTNKVPAVTDRVGIDAPGDITVVHNSGNTSIISLNSQESLNISGGSLTVNAASVVSGTFTMAGRTNLTANDVGASFTVSGPAMVDGANLYALNGGRIYLAGTTSYRGYTGFNHTTLRASGADSLIDLSNVITLTGNGASNTTLIIEAKAGGQVDFSGVTTIPGGKVQVLADGTNSQVDLSALTSFTKSGTGTSNLQVKNSGTILNGNLANLSGVDLIINSNGTLSTGQINSYINGGTATINGVTPDFSGLTNINGAGFIVTAGGVADLSSITNYQGFTGSSNTTLRASGTGSLVNMSNVITLTGNGFSNAELVIEALSGGRIDLGSTTTIPGGKVQVLADGTGSQVDLSTLSSFTKTGNGTSNLEATNGGTIMLSSDTTEFKQVEVILSDTGTLTIGSLTLLPGSILSGMGTLTATVINEGVIQPGTSAGSLTITGDYTQTVAGTLTIELGGLTPGSLYDQLNVSGNVALDGTLNVNLINSFIPGSGNSFQVLTYGSRNGTFATINSNGPIYTPNYNATDLTLVTQ